MNMPATNPVSQLSGLAQRLVQENLLDAVIGPHFKHKNCFVFNGLGTKGVMLAPYFAKEMCLFLMNRGNGLLSEINVTFL